MSWLEFWPEDGEWTSDSILLDEIIEGLYWFVIHHNSVFCTRAFVIAKVDGGDRVYAQIDRPQEYAIIRGLLRHRQWPTKEGSSLEVRELSEQLWDVAWEAAGEGKWTTDTIVFRPPVFSSFCSLLKTHWKRTDEELDLSQLPLSEAHQEMLGWPTADKPLHWKDAPAAGYMPVEWKDSTLLEEGYYLKHFNGRAPVRGLRSGPRARTARRKFEGPENEDEDEAPRKTPRLHERLGVDLPEDTLGNQEQGDRLTLEDRLAQGSTTLGQRMQNSPPSLLRRFLEETKESKRIMNDMGEDMEY
ncbi:hypothetical protein CYLTODRAFT_419288 [Cylindrobasidium torrendii FP15055 ss-10]|uniref:Uncharacterized protein n=1 Tax=Cylindrobasidium torrendii FP15055 ss-10 TaxID=1314674 RepID=A0A0D7BL68_9AGAR|nr:hypothetical protein CYLTODRAFT_419288 [Cylindrobasidium torrendii FP15055 ss-10]